MLSVYFLPELSFVGLLVLLLLLISLSGGVAYLVLLVVAHCLADLIDVVYGEYVVGIHLSGRLVLIKLEVLLSLK